MPKKLQCALTFISFLMVISCASTGRNAWRNVASLDEMLGEWEGIIYIRHSEESDSPMLEIPVTLSISTDNDQNYIYDETADYEHVYEQIVDAVIKYYEMIDDEDYLAEHELWEAFVSLLDHTIYFSESFFKKYYNHEFSDFFLEKYYIRIMTAIPFEERDIFDGYNYQLDQSGDRLKKSFCDIVPAPFIMQEEVILQRRE